MHLKYDVVSTFYVIVMTGWINAFESLNYKLSFSVIFSDYEITAGTMITFSSIYSGCTSGEYN